MTNASAPISIETTKGRYATIEVSPSGVATVWLDQEGERVNTISPEMMGEFVSFLDRIEKDSSIKAAVIASRKDDFIAGANIEMLLAITEPGKAAELTRGGHQLLDRLESCAKPVVAAIHGACLGGGLEVALACRARIASDHPKTVLGLPEVQLGLLPGAGGTQRLTRLVGLTRALDAMLTGKRIYARPALSMGLVDALMDPHGLAGAAARLALAMAEGRSVLAHNKRRKGLVKWFLDDTPPGRALVFAQARKQVHRETRGNYPAPLAILECVEAGLGQGIRAGLEAESKGFDELVRTPAAKNLIRLFLGMTARKKNPHAALARKTRTIGILGAGLMGAGIANASVQKGTDVVLKDLDWPRVAGGLKHIWQELDRLVQKKAMRRTERDRTFARVAGAVDLAALRHVDLVIEAVFEDLEVKRKVVREVEAALGESSAIFASNTSALPIAGIAEASKRPEQVIGMHYFSPVEKMPLLEIITTGRTADWVLATALDVAIRQGKTPIVVGDGPGFYTSRILGPYMNEAMLLLEEGADVGELDSALKDFGFPVGPITLLDEVGIDVAAHVSRFLGKEFAKRGGRASGLVERLIAAGYQGRKNRRGFYRYDRGGFLMRLVRGKGKKVNRKVYKVIGAPGRKAIPRAAMAERLSLAMVNEAARCLEEGILRSPSDGDIGAVLGLGFPPFRGGPFRHADDLGARKVVERLEDLARTCGAQMEPAEILRRHAREGTKFFPQG